MLAGEDFGHTSATPRFLLHLWNWRTLNCCMGFTQETSCDNRTYSVMTLNPWGILRGNHRTSKSQLHAGSGCAVFTFRGVTMKFSKNWLLWSVLIALSGCRGPAFNLPPAEQLMAPGPGVDGPGPGVFSSADYGSTYAPCDAGMVEDGGAIDGPMPSVQVMFTSPGGMHVVWDMTGQGGFEADPLVVPARTNFTQAGLYRFKLTNIPGHEGAELYPTLEVGPPTRNTLAFLAHNTLPVQLTVDDFNQVAAGNYVTKVIYLPDPDFQQLAVAGVETLVSTRLDPGVDPIQEADRRGSIMAILRIGNKDIEMPGMAPETFQSFNTTNGAGEIAQVGYDEVMMAGGSCGAGSCPAPMRGYSGAAMNDCGCAGEFCAAPGPGPMNNPGPVYGMPMTGTPIGLPGPPHIPLGGPAGLRKHVIHNHTHTYIPDPTRDVKIHVKQHPAVSYPAPRSRAWIHQYNHPDCAHCVGSGG